MQFIATSMNFQNVYISNEIKFNNPNPNSILFNIGKRLINITFGYACHSII